MQDVSQLAAMTESYQLPVARCQKKQNTETVGGVCGGGETIGVPNSLRGNSEQTGGQISACNGQSERENGTDSVGTCSVSFTRLRRCLRKVKIVTPNPPAPFPRPKGIPCGHKQGKGEQDQKRRNAQT
jgi:hypothetical protein